MTVVVAMNLAWELFQLPFYTIWQTGTPRQLVYAALHCTIGDVFIAAASLLLALLAVGGRNWPYTRLGRVAAVTILLGVAYTILSEWLNVAILQRWSYSGLMPLVPFFRTGLAPLLQWIVIPTLGFLYIRLQLRRTKIRQHPN